MFVHFAVCLALPDRISYTLHTNDWQLQRISWRELRNQNQYKFSMGNIPTYAYILDSGINDSIATDYLGDGIDLTNTDCDDNTDTKHGTTVAKLLLKVAPKAIVVPVKIFDPAMLDKTSSSYAQLLLNGLYWAIEDAQSKEGKAVINISSSYYLPGDCRYSTEIKKAIQFAYEQGIVVVVSAGNNNIDNCWERIANIPEVITVGAITKSNKIHPQSNYGPAITLFAPSEEGTSYAAPLVAGVACLLQSMNIPNIKQVLIDTATKNQILMKPSEKVSPSYLQSPNRIVYNKM